METIVLGTNATHKGGDSQSHECPRQALQLAWRSNEENSERTAVESIGELFYKLEHTEDDAIVEDNSRYSIDGVYIQCPLCPDNHPRRTRYEPESRVKLSANELFDITQSWSSNWFVTERVAELFAREGLTGYEPVRTTIVKDLETKEAVPGAHLLYKLSITGWGGVASRESGTRLVEKCLGCNYRAYSGIQDGSRLFDINQWDGSDFFIIWPLPGYVIVTERVKRLLERHAGRDITFLWLGRAWNIPDRLAPGLLTDCFGFERAKRIAEQLDEDYGLI